MSVVALGLLLATACPATPGINDAGHDAGVEPTDGCGGVGCGADQRCVSGVCVARACGPRLCAANETCVDAGACVESACVGIGCPTGERCTGGSCVPQSCAAQPCGSDEVCIDEACVERACAQVQCDAGPCLAGACQGPTCGDAGPCGPASGCLNDRCVDLRCLAVSCAPGFQCAAGQCVPGCAATQPRESSCGDGVDDDCDGLADCADSDCEARPCLDDGHACSLDVCGAGQCMHRLLDAGAVCRPSIGGCDVAERCTGASPSCPSDVFDAGCACPEQGPLAGYAEGDGLRAISATGFSLQDTDTWSRYAAMLDALGLPKVGLDVLPLNRSATAMPAKSWPGFGGGFFWESGDLDARYWIPQGLAEGVAGARSMVAVAWHYESANVAFDPNPSSDGADKGVRVSFADVTGSTASVTYRHALLVEPDPTRGFKPVPIHGGGLAWSGSLLYVADTSRGLRVFDLTRISKVATAAACATRAGVAAGQACAYGYEYVLPQVGGYYFPSGLSPSCRAKFSFVSLDRSTTPDSLVSGEFDDDPALGLYSRLLRWPLESASSRLKTGPTGVVTASGAWYAGNRNLQGAVSAGPRFFLNSTRYEGALFSGAVGALPTTLRASDDRWGYMPEGMHLSASGRLWVSTEGHSLLPRSVYFVLASGLP